jgi:transcriptional regulator with XRE-family HTH domain
MYSCNFVTYIFVITLFMKDIHLKIRNLRLSKNYTQDFLAECIGVSLRTYQNIESGKSPITLSRIEKISEILGETATRTPSSTDPPLSQATELSAMRTTIDALTLRIEALELAHTQQKNAKV